MATIGILTLVNSLLIVLILAVEVLSAKDMAEYERETRRRVDFLYEGQTPKEQSNEMD